MLIGGATARAGAILCAIACTAAAALNPIYGRYCTASAPPGWFVAAESAQRVAFGADLQSGDGMAGASYAVFSAGALNIVPGNETPERAVANAITLSGWQPARFGTRQQIGPDEFQIEFQNASSRGYAFYHVFPAGPGSYMIVLRQAITGTGVWRQRSAEAAAVARSVHCNVPDVPPDYHDHHHHRHHRY
jgi:hypothetical protein